MAGSPVNGKEGGAEPRGQHSLSVGASHQQGFRVKRQVECTPFLAVWGQGPSILTTKKEGLGAKASQGCWGKLQGVTHFSAQNADLLGFSAICPTDPWGTSSTPQAPFSGILLHSHGGLRKLKAPPKKEEDV